jgi:hypothetical protein
MILHYCEYLITPEELTPKSYELIKGEVIFKNCNSSRLQELKFRLKLKLWKLKVMEA